MELCLVLHNLLAANSGALYGSPGRWSSPKPSPSFDVDIVLLLIVSSD